MCHVTRKCSSCPSCALPVPLWFFCPSDLPWAKKWSFLCLQLVEVNQLEFAQGKKPTSCISYNKAIGNAEMSQGHSEVTMSPSHPIPRELWHRSSVSPVSLLSLALDFRSRAGCGNAVTPCCRWPQSLAVLTLPLCSLPNPGVYIRWSWTLWKAAQQSCY